ncbi:MAG: hypothetical protein ABSF59_15525 [Candidatus Sulfotelmatobacter sp.]
MFNKALFFGLLFLVGAGPGLYAGWELSSSRLIAIEKRGFDDPRGKNFLKTCDLFARLSSVNMGSAMRLQDPKQSPERRRESLNLLLDTAQKGRSSVTDPAALTLVDVEIGITDVRLAMVEEAAGNLPASQVWMQKAQATLKQAGWKDYSEQHLKKLVLVMNEQDGCDSPCGKK